MNKSNKSSSLLPRCEAWAQTDNGKIGGRLSVLYSFLTTLHSLLQFSLPRFH